MASERTEGAEKAPMVPGEGVDMGRAKKAPLRASKRPVIGRGRTAPQKEQSIMGEIATWLSFSGWHVVRVNSGAFRIETDGGRGRFFRASTPGMTDLIAIRDSCVLWIEVKALKGKQSDVQLAFESEVTRRGGCYVLARGISDVEAAIEKLWYVVPDRRGGDGVKIRPVPGMRLSTNVEGENGE